jgi:lysozyme
MRKLFLIPGLLLVASLVTAMLIIKKSDKSIIDIMETFTVKGIDVSHHQGEIDWEKVKNDSISFAFIKATDGRGFKDDKFNYNITEASKRGIVVGAYHYFRFGADPYLQFKNFQASVPKDIINLPPVLDLEYLENESLKDGNNKTKLLHDVRILEGLIREHYGVKPIFYTTSDYYKSLIENEFENEIWICKLKNEKINFLEDNQWNFRQYSFTGRVDGIKGDVDLDFFKGSKEELLTKFIKKA